MTNQHVINDENKVMHDVAYEICKYFGFHDETIGESFYRALKRGDFKYLQLKPDQLGDGDVD
ncbi:hypothetical protein [Escherichia coli]|uniref:hypothetical protein n=1 Tax=Escherichia coli TaxID=562 RepID=UPI0015C54C27|nr:hypothetical protein [Escherichia coli]